jgi:spermidine synthase
MGRAPLLFINVFIIATCGLIYELVAGTLASYLLGNSVMQFSTCIGVYLFALGIGAWLSVAVLGGFSAPALFLSFAKVAHFHVVLYGLVLAIGTLVGLELPLLMRILRENLDFKDLVARVLTFDYIGALAASLAFPLLLVPSLGLVRTSLMFGFFNCVVGLWGTWILKSSIEGSVFFLRVRGAVVLLLLSVAFIKADAFTTYSEDLVYNAPIVYTETTPYQRIVITNQRGGFQLFLDRNLQFNSFDEYRYHEALAHPPILVAGDPRRILVLGGGDGLAVREVLRHTSVESVTLVDLDPRMTALPDSFPPLKELNEAALDDERVEIINADAMIWLETKREPFDVAIIDFPDPNNFSLGKLYTRRFYQLLRKQLTPEAAVSIQCTSAIHSRRSYWCIINTMRAAGFHVRPYHVPVPSFGDWGFALARLEPFEAPKTSPPNLRYLNDETLAAIFVLSNDLREMETEVNRLDNQILLQYYENDWIKLN